MEAIYKSCSEKYSNEDIFNMVGLTSFVPHERLLKTSIYDAIKKKDNEVLVGMKIDDNGITCYIEIE